jgi:hypothetical protein
MQQKAFENQQDYIRQQERFIERFKAKASKAAQAQSIQKRLDKSFSNTDKLTIPLKDRNGNQLNVKDAKFIAVTGPNGSEHILVEVRLDKPLDPSFAPLAVESTQSELEQGSRILTGGYTPEGYRESLNGRVVSTTLQSGVANDILPNGEDPKGDDKTYHSIFLASNVPGVQPGTSGGTAAIIKNGKAFSRGTITAKNNRDKVNEYIKTKKEKNPLFRVELNIRGRLKQYLKQKNITQKNKTYHIVGIEINDLKKHIEKQFTKGMNWENYGVYGWHIDHIIPLCSANDENELLKLFHY